MRVRITFEVSLESRRALAAHMGHAEPLRHRDVAEWMYRTLGSTLEVIRSEHDTKTED